MTTPGQRRVTQPGRPPAAPMWSRRALLVLGLATLLAAVVGGLERVGLWSARVPATWVAFHGALMVSGFFGVVISLERAVALSGRWPLLAPASALAGIALVVTGHATAGAALFVLASLLLVLLCGLVVKRQLASFTLLLALGAGAWTIGNAAWLLTGAVSAAVWWWVAFLVVTIVAERLELSRLVRRPRAAEPALVAFILALLVGVATDTLVVAGIALVAIAAWLTRYDVARRTIRKDGLARYAASALLSGFFWLAVCGVLLILKPDAARAAGLWYDAALHSALVGFVLAMVFAHAPIILPAVARLDLRYEPALYAPLVVLHASLLARVIGDVVAHEGLRHAGALGNALTLVVFGAVALSGVARRRWRARTAPLSNVEVRA